MRPHIPGFRAMVWKYVCVNEMQTGSQQRSRQIEDVAWLWLDKRKCEDEEITLWILCTLIRGQKEPCVVFSNTSRKMWGSKSRKVVDTTRRCKSKDLHNVGKLNGASKYQTFFYTEFFLWMQTLETKALIVSFIAVFVLEVTGRGSWSGASLCLKVLY